MNSHGIIGKRCGVDDLKATRTTVWDTPIIAPDGTEYIASFSQNDAWKDWVGRWASAGFPMCYKEIEMPPEWIINEEGL